MRVITSMYPLRVATSLLLQMRPLRLADPTGTVAHPGIATGISEASKRVPIFSFANQGGKQASSYSRERN